MNDKQRKVLRAIEHLVEKWKEECREGQVLVVCANGYKVTVQPEEKTINDKDMRELTAMARKAFAAREKKHRALAGAKKFIEERKIPVSMVREAFMISGASAEEAELFQRMMNLCSEGFTLEEVEEIMEEEDAER